MAIKLVAVDLDDTLLNKSNKVSPYTREVIREAVKQGVTVTVATGRMYQSAIKFARQLELDVPIITYNGALIKSCLSEEVLFEKLIDQETTREVLAFFRERGWYIQSYVDDKLCVAEINDKARYYEQAAEVKAIALGEDFYAPDKGTPKLLSIAEPSKIPVMWKAVEARFKDKLYITKSKPNYLEIANPGINKGIALAYLADKLNIKQEEVMAVGDSLNDLDMIEYAGWGVAMGNASDHVKKLAQAVTLCNYEDGVAEAIKKFVLK